MDQVLKIDSICVSFGAKHVLREVSLSVHKGEMFGLVGLNGAGKTTLIKTILGLRNANSGCVEIFGRETQSKEGRYDIAYLPERFEPPSFLTGYEFLKFSFRLYNMSFEKAAIEEAAQKLALDLEALGRKIGSYSKGMRQKLGLLATISTGCALIILDEPMSGLDPVARSRVKDLLIDAKSHDQTIVICSHILADMEEICDRVSLLHDGIFPFVGKPSDLIRQTGQDNLERAFLSFIEPPKAA